MPYYIRVLSTQQQCIPVSAIRAALQKGKYSAILNHEGGTELEWDQCLLSHVNEKEIALIERNPSIPGSLGESELEEFAEDIEDCYPVTARQWLLEEFHKVKCIYAFQLLSGTELANGWDIVACVKSAIMSVAPAIIQADNEGFSNEDGYHILWQFSDDVRGEWWMGVLQEGSWKHFCMDLANPSHRKAFKEGRIPVGVKMAV